MTKPFAGVSYSQNIAGEKIKSWKFGC